MSYLRKPSALKEGDLVAAVATSAGLASIFPHQYEHGKKQIEKEFGLKVIAAPNALKSHAELRDNPKLRADDLNWAFGNKEIKAIIAIIGGDDCLKTLPYLDLNLIKNNPKVFMGYSDPTIVHLLCYKLGFSSIYGPTIMSGFGENVSLVPSFVEFTRKVLFSSEEIGEVAPSPEGWTEEFLDWANPENLKIRRKFNDPLPYVVVQGNQGDAVEGRLLGGNLETLDVTMSTDLFPSIAEWSEKILFLEMTDGDHYPLLSSWLRKVGNLGVFSCLKGIVFGRPKNAKGDFDRYDNLLKQVSVEYGRADLPILTRVNFGHTDPLCSLPYGALARIDTKKGSFSVLEGAVR